jgi:hypothetical protein
VAVQIAQKETTITFTNVPSTTQLPAGKEGYVWVEGNNLCYICSNRWKHTIVGADISSLPGVSKAGYLWLDNNALHWVGANGHDYAVPWNIKQFASTWSGGASGPTYAGTAKYGYFWVDDEFGETHLALITSDGYKRLVGSGHYPYQPPY